MSSETGQVALRVQGVARVPMAGSLWGTVVRILTPAGEFYRVLGRHAG